MVRKLITCSWSSNSFCHFGHVDDYCFYAITLAFNFSHKSRHFISIECITDIPININATHICSYIVPILSITCNVSLNGCDFLCRLQQYFDVLCQQISIKIIHLKNNIPVWVNLIILFNSYRKLKPWYFKELMHLAAGPINGSMSFLQLPDLALDNDGDTEKINFFLLQNEQ